MSAFGPTALATPANAVTVTRLLASPLLFAMVADLGPQGSWLALVAWMVLSCTDGVDGWLARRHGTTRSGAFLDPLADKVLVLGALMVLVTVDRFWWVPVALIAARELGISLYRSVAGAKGVSVPAKPIAKVKTVMQVLAVAIVLAPPTADEPDLASAVLWVAVALTLVSGWVYVREALRAV